MPIRQTTPPEAHKLLGEGYRYIDVRTEPEFANGHPASAVNIPVVLQDPATRQMVPNPDFLTVFQAHFPKDAKVIVGCQVGGRSQRAAELLAAAGYSNIVNMQGGFGGFRDQTGKTVVSGWKESNLPICNDCGPENSHAALRAAALK
jgi:rhodanese-related sulfurtransferase